ncbi:hypothetical protein FSP39_006091 [Pinctada imbricata]|uniref:UDENN domain-containing protein n=1 Tax=Pinctada imbricata TaxID=66713 RepID=A0AA89CA00_PINIB|nr:hypothetical protein FSP39_006091 [Pinctada imbricata]
MADSEDPSSSLRQLPPGKMTNIMKMFENTTDNTPPGSSRSGQSSPYRQRPVSVLTNDVPELRDSRGRTDKLRPHSEMPTGPTVAKMMNRIQNATAEGTPRPKPRDGSPQKSLPEKPVTKKKSFGGADMRPKPPVVMRQRSSQSTEGEESSECANKQLNVVQRRTQMFENSPTPNTNLTPQKPTPPVKPRSRPPSSNLDEEQKSPKHAARANAYCEAWDIKNKGKFEIFEIGELKNKPNIESSAISSSEQIPSPSKIPPKKPPRTGAHDEYMRVKLKTEADGKVTGKVYDQVPDEVMEDESENTPVYRRIHKSRPPSGDISSDTLKSKKPNRPPPPRPVTVVGSNLTSNGSVTNDKEKPDVPAKPVTPKRFHVYEEITCRLDLDKIKHWDLDNQPRKGLRRSLSAECIPSDTAMGSPIYVDPDSLGGFRDDIYVDNAGYAVPHGQHRQLAGIKSLDHGAGQFCRPLSDAVLKQLKKLKPPGRSKRESARANWKKLQNVKMKINMAFAVLRQMKPENRPQDSQAGGDKTSEDEDSLVDLKEIEKRINHCGLVRKNTSKSIRKSRIIQTQIYPQLFEFCLIVGLEAKEDQSGFIPKVIYKFPAHVDCNVSIPEFCFPDAEEFDVKMASPAAPSESYSFVLTNVDAERVFGYCRRVVPFSSRDHLPEVMCIISPVDAFSMYSELLDEVENCRHKSLDLAKELLSAAFGRPLPNPGDMVQVRTLDENWDTGTILLARPSDYRTDNVNQEYLLSKLGVDKLLKLFSCILLERSVLFCAKNLSVLSQTIHALVSLLYPFRWQHTYIPVLPESMLDVCCSPTPYIIGILSSQLSYVQTLPISEIVIFDLNKKQMVKCQGDEGTLLPKEIQKALKTALNMCKVDADAKSAQNLMITETFLRMFVESVGHYSNHITTQQDGQKVFHKEGFIQSAATESIQQFLQWFTETQMFEVFITEQTEKLVPKRKTSRTIG